MSDPVEPADGGVATDPTPSPEPSTDPSPQPDLFDRFEEAGLDLRDKYTDEASLIKGVTEASRLVGKRNEKAEGYDQILQAIQGREKEFGDFLAGKLNAQPATPASTDSPQTQPVSKAEYQLLQSRVYDDSGKVRSGANQDDIRRLRDADERIAEATVRIAMDPKGFFSEALGDFKQSLLEELAEKTNSTLAVEKRQTRLQQINEREKSLLYVNGDPSTGLTKWGDKAVAEYEALVEAVPELDKKVHHVGLWEKAIANVKGSIPKPRNTLTPNPRAEHQTPIGTPTAPKVDEKDFFRKHRGPGALVALMKHKGIAVDDDDDGGTAS